MGNKKIIIAVGHTESGTNGSGVSGYLDESNCNREIVPLVVNILNGIEGYEAKELRIDKGNSYQFEDCYTRCQLSNEWGADLYVEIHLNGFSTSSACGTEVLVNSENSNAITYAKRVNANLCNALGTFDRTYGKGYKTQNLIVLQKTNAPALLVECLFATNESDSSKYNANTIATCIAEGLTNQTINVTSKPYIAKATSSKSVSPIQKAKEFVGNRCLELQKLLIAKGYNCGGYGADGSFGQGTYNSLIQFQKDNPPLISDGLAGDKTFAKLKEVVKATTSKNVLLIQQLCNFYGARIEEDNRYGSQTENAIKQYLPLCGIPYTTPRATLIIQKILGIQEDGVFMGGSEEAVKNFQLSHNLQNDGIVGFNSWKALALS